METDEQLPADGDIQAQNIDTDGGAVITGKVTVKGGNFYARDKVIHQNALEGPRIQIAIATEGSTLSNSPVTIGDVTGRDKIIQGDEVHGDKFPGNKIVYQQITPKAVDEATLAAANAKLTQLPLDTVPSITALPPGSQMPFPINELFVGRQEELKQLAATLKAGTTAAIAPVAAATGLGGIGKTQLAVAFVHHYGQFFAGGVYWLSFADPAAISSQIASFGYAMPDLRADYATLDLENQVRQVCAALQNALPRLLIFDNCEDPALLAQWRPTSGGSRVLVTSRRHHWEDGFNIQTLPLETLTRNQSIELLRKFRPDLAVDDPTLNQIADYLGDLPLALHLAGSYLKRYQHELSLVSYLTQLRQPDLMKHRSLQSGGHSPTGHEQHLARTFALSYDKLNPTQPTDVIALALLTIAACFAPGQWIPRHLLLATILSPVNTTDGAEEAILQRADALLLLENLGLLESDAKGNLLLHRLLAAFIQSIEPAASQFAQQAVAEAFLAEAHHINDTGIPGPLLTWQIHLRHITTEFREQSTELVTDLCNTLGFHLHMIGDYAAARLYLEQAAVIDEGVLGAKHPDTATSLNNLGMLLQTQGEYAAARPYLERSLTITEEVLGAKHPDTATSLNNLGMLLQAQGEYADARSYYERALAIRKEVLGAKHPSSARCLNNLGMLLHEQGKYEAARPYLEQALTIYEEVLGTNHPSTANSLNNFGNLLQAQGEYLTARPYLEQSLAIREKLLGVKHPDTAQSLNNLGYLLHAQGRYESARPFFERALTIYEEVLGAKHPYTQAVRKNLAALDIN